jgi:hypothetical protein
MCPGRYDPRDFDMSDQAKISYMLFDVAFEEVRSNLVLIE